MPIIRFQAKLTAIGSHTIVKLPKVSGKLRSRGMNLVEGTFLPLISPAE